MYFKRSGKVPDKSKLLAVFLILPILLGGCQLREPMSSQSTEMSFSSEFSQDSSVSSEISQISQSSQTLQTSQVSQSSETSESTDNTHVPDTSEPSSRDETSDNSGSSENVSDPESTDSSESTTETSETDSSEEVSSDTSTTGSSSGSVSSAESSREPESTTEPPVSSSSSSAEPPIEVIIPDIVVPTSPGTQTAMGQTGAVDYSNASQGYISARYTGGSAKVKLRISANGGEYNHDVDPGGATEYYPLSFGSGSYTVILFEQIPSTGKYALVTQADFNVSLNSELSPFLCPNRYVDYSRSSDAVYKAAELCAGKTSAIDKISAVFTWVADNISYDYDLAATVTSGYVPNPDRTLSRRTGICFDYASLICAMMRSQSIPTRLVIGNASPDIYHAWNEVYTEETGWITPELLLKSAGYNILDATFYSSSPDKAQIAEYISNGANYTVKYYY